MLKTSECNTMNRIGYKLERAKKVMLFGHLITDVTQLGDLRLVSNP